MPANEFEACTHAQLHAMIAAIDPEAVRTRGTQLTDAADAIRKIGEQLKDHKVTGWDGEAAEAFREWANRTGSAALVLAEYSAAGGKQMTEAAQTMSEVRPDPDGKGAMPPYSASREATLKSDLARSREHHNDPDAVQLGQEAWRKLNGDHARAVDALNKLAGRYELSSAEMDRATLPTFPPPPEVLLPVGVDGQSALARPGGVYVAPGSASARQPQSDTTLRPTTGPVLAALPGVPEHDVHMALDHVRTLPNPTLPPTTGGVPLGGPVLAVSAVPPGPPPCLPLPPVAGMPKSGGGLDPFGPYPTLTGPGGSGGKSVGSMGLPPREAGIVGGKAVTSTGPPTGLPRGTVIGTEGQQGAGRGMGGGMGHGGGGGAPGGYVGSPVGRRLATDPGSVAGGHQSGMAGRPVTGGQPFTQGGSGLVRNNRGGAGVGALSHADAGTRAPGQRREGQGDERPDYLTEDEETWQSDRRVVPPVID